MKKLLTIILKLIATVLVSPFLAIGLFIWGMIWAHAITLDFIVNIKNVILGKDVFEKIPIKYYILMIVYAPVTLVVTIIAGVFYGIGKLIFNTLVMIDKVYYKL